MYHVVVFVVATIGARRGCAGVLAPPWLPSEFGRHGTVSPLSVGSGAVLCCDGAWGGVPVHGAHVDRLSRAHHNPGHMYAIVVPSAPRELQCDPRTEELLALDVSGAAATCKARGACDAPCEPWDPFCPEASRPGVCSASGAVCRLPTAPTSHACPAAHAYPAASNEGDCVHSDTFGGYAKCCNGELATQGVGASPLVVYGGYRLWVYGTRAQCDAAACPPLHRACRCHTPEFMCNRDGACVRPNQAFVVSTANTCPPHASMPQFEDPESCEEACTGSPACTGYSINTTSMLRCSLLDDRCGGVDSGTSGFVTHWKRRTGVKNTPWAAWVVGGGEVSNVTR